MAKTTKKEVSDKKTDTNSEEKKPWKISRQQKMLLGSLLVLFSIALLLAFISFFIHGQEDQSAVDALNDRKEGVNNWLGKFGAFLSDIFIFKGFGAASFFFVRLFFLTGAFLFLDISVKKLKSIWFWDLFVIVILSILFGFFATSLPELGGTIGYEMNLFSQDYIGKTGTLLALVFGILVYLIFKLKISPDTISSFFESKKKDLKDDLNSIKSVSSDGKYNLEEFAVNEDEDEPIAKPASQFEINKESLKPTISNSSEINMEPTLKTSSMQMEVTPTPTEEPYFQSETPAHAEEFIIEKPEEEDIVEENLASRLVADFGLFDPTLDLSNYKFPTLDLLKEYNTGGITINQEELEENKNRIVETLRNYKI